ncbi:MAG: conjugative transposon protein TraM [Bacteroidetes bacterium]|nr:conjugative transposon protein TraM [Bacteroidota bacterium]
MNNKKLTNILTFSLGGLLVLFIVVRLINKNAKEKVTELEPINLNYDPQKEKEVSKIQQIEEEKRRKESDAYSDKYLTPNYNSLFSKTAEMGTDGRNPSGSERSTSTTYESQSSFSKTSDPTNLGFESEFLKNREKQQNSTTETPPITSLQENEKSAPTTKNPFGTVKKSGTEKMEPVPEKELFSQGEIYGDQKISPNGAATIRLLEAITYKGNFFPKNSILYGQANFSDNRVYIKINRIKCNFGEFPIALSVIDNDRIAGIYYKAPVDESVKNTSSDVNIPTVGRYGAVVKDVTEKVIQEGKNYSKNSQSLSLEDGYKIFLTTEKN